MAGNLQLPPDLTKVVEVKDTSDPLREFLTQLLNTQEAMKAQILSLEERVKALE